MGPDTFFVPIFCTLGMRTIRYGCLGFSEEISGSKTNPHTAIEHKTIQTGPDVGGPLSLR